MISDMEASRVNVLAQLIDAEVGAVISQLLRRFSERVTAVDDRIRLCQAKVNAITQHSKKPEVFFSTSINVPHDRLSLTRERVLMNTESGDMHSLTAVHSSKSRPLLQVRIPKTDLERYMIGLLPRTDSLSNLSEASVWSDEDPELSAREHCCIMVHDREPLVYSTCGTLHSHEPSAGASQWIEDHELSCLDDWEFVSPIECTGPAPPLPADLMKDIRAPTVKLRKISESVIAQPRISDSVHEPLESAGMLMKEQFQQRGRCDLLSEIRHEQTRQRDRARMVTRTQALTTNKTDALLAPLLTPDHSDGFKLHPPQTLSDVKYVCCTLNPPNERQWRLPARLPLEDIPSYIRAVEAGADPSIAPSVAQTNVLLLPDLPDVGGFPDCPPPPAASCTEFSIESVFPPPPPPPEYVEMPTILPQVNDDIPPPPAFESAEEMRPLQERVSAVTSRMRYTRYSTASSHKRPTLSEEIEQRMRRRLLCLSGKQNKAPSPLIQFAKPPECLLSEDELPLKYATNYCGPSMGDVEDQSAQLPTKLPLDNIANCAGSIKAGANKSIASSLFQYESTAIPDLPSTWAFTNDPAVPKPFNQSVQDELQDGPALPLPPPPPAFDSVFLRSLPLPPTAPYKAENEEEYDMICSTEGLLCVLRKVKRGKKKRTASREQTSEVRPVPIGEAIKQSLERRKLIISGKQDKMDQQHDRESMAGPMTVVTAVEITAPPPLPPLENPKDSESSAQEYDRVCSREGSRYVLRQVKRETNHKSTIRQRPLMQESTNSLAYFETRMVGLRSRAASLSIAENSDWSGD